MLTAAGLSEEADVKDMLVLMGRSLFPAVSDITAGHDIKQKEVKVQRPGGNVLPWIVSSLHRFHWLWTFFLLLPP